MRKVTCWLFSLILCGSLAGKEIVVASYNVDNYLLDDRQKDGVVMKDAPKPEQEIAAVIQSIGQIRPDIVGLVEIGDESMLDDLRSD
jgi:predicted extracellular nuclease